MSSMKWRAECDKPRTPNAMALVITPNGRRSIDATGSGPTYADDCANARLIAEAPTMAALLEKFLSGIYSANDVEEAHALLERIKCGA